MTEVIRAEKKGNYSSKLWKKLGALHSANDKEGEVHGGLVLGNYLETDPDPIAMVIGVELFIHKPCRQKTPVI